MNSVAKFFFAVFLLTAGPLQAQVNDSSVEPLAPAFGEWRPTSGNLYEALRSNAPYYWGWLKKNSSDNLFSALGVVIGDPHILNFGDIELLQGGRDYGLIDMDDGGANVPMLGDYLHFYISTQLSSFKKATPSLWTAYLAGLRGQKMDKPKVLKEAEQESDLSFAQNQKKYLDKMMAQGLFSAKAELTPLAQASADILQIYNQSKADILREMTGQKILDSGFRMKDEGGSQGLVRFWFLLSGSDGEHIWEFKLETLPATSMFASQPTDAVQRFNELAMIYRPAAAVRGPYKFLQAGPNTFLLREKFKNFLKIEGGLMGVDGGVASADSFQQASAESGEQVSVYIANRMGVWQSQQKAAPELLRMIDQNPSAAKQLIENLAAQCILQMKNEQAKAGY